MVGGEREELALVEEMDSALEDKWWLTEMFEMFWERLDRVCRGLWSWWGA